MSGFLIKNMPVTIQRRLKDRAKRNQRSMVKEALVLLQEALENNPADREFPPALKGKFPLSDKILRSAKQGRA